MKNVREYRMNYFDKAMVDFAEKCLLADSSTIATTFVQHMNYNGKPWQNINRSWMLSQKPFLIIYPKNIDKNEEEYRVSTIFVNDSNEFDFSINASTDDDPNKGEHIKGLLSKYETDMKYIRDNHNNTDYTHLLRQLNEAVSFDSDIAFYPIVFTTKKAFLVSYALYTILPEECLVNSFIMSKNNNYNRGMTMSVLYDVYADELEEWTDGEILDVLYGTSVGEYTMDISVKRSYTLNFSVENPAYETRYQISVQFFDK